MSDFTYSVLDGDLDRGTFEFVDAPHQIAVKPRWAFHTAAPFDVMSVRAWHRRNYTEVVEFCKERRIGLRHVYDGIRVVVPEGDPMHWMGGPSTKQLVVELASLGDLMLFKLSWVNE